MVDTHLFLNKKCQGTNLLDARRKSNEHDGHGTTLPAKGAEATVAE